MIENLIILPVIAQLFIAIFLLIFWRNTGLQKLVSVFGSILATLAAIWLFAKVWGEGIHIMNAGNWNAPFGIVFVADVFSSTMVLLSSIAGLAVSIFATASVSRQRAQYGFFPVFHLLIMGLNGAFLTGDIFNLYVWFEVIIISSFVLLTLGGRKGQIEGAVKYMAMNILASMIFLTGIGMLYGITGTLNMADLALKVAAVENRNLINLTAVFFIVGFGIKSAVFPLYFWLPSSYHTPPSAVAAIFGGLLTKVGIYALFRIFTLIFVPDLFLETLFIVIAVLTIMTGAFGAAIKQNIRRMFSYLIVCHIGFMVAGLGLFNKVAMMGALFYLIHDIVIKTNLFLVAGVIRNIGGSMYLDKLGGLYANWPKTSILMAIVLFSLVGIPPLSGFWPKIYLFEGGFMEANYFFVGALIIGSFVTLYAIARLWVGAFWKDAPDEEIDRSAVFGVMDFVRWPRAKQSLLIIPIILLAVVSLYFGLFAEHIVVLVDHIAEEMIDPTPYIQAVLGKNYSP